jgi:GTP1/Obg family GTP-binding protein
MKVLFLSEVRDYFRELAEILYEKDYFGFEEAAIQYAEDLFNNIADTLPTRVKKTAPAYFDRYGKDMLYTVFRKNEAVSKV